MQTPTTQNELARVAFICGILAILPGCCCGPFGIPLSIVALVMGLVAMRQGGTARDKNLAIAAAIFGGAAIGLDFLGIALDAFEALRPR